MTAPLVNLLKPNRPDGGDRVRAYALIAAAGMVGILVMAMPTVGRVIFGIVGLLIFTFFASTNRELAVCLVLVWLTFLGFVRRLLIPFIGYSPVDPLLLVSPATAVILLLFAWRRGVRPPRSLHTTLCILLFLWVVASVVNPVAPNLYVNLQAAMFYLTPLLWFFVGRTFSPETHSRMLNTLFWLATPVIALGLYHSLVDFLPFEYTWVGVSGQSTAIFFPGFRIRPFSTLVSPQEYGHFLAMSIVVIVAKIYYSPSSRYRLLLLGYVGIAGVALFLQASRTNLLLTILALAVITVVKLRSFAFLVATVAAGSLLALVTLRADVAPVQETADQAQEDPNTDAPGKTAVLAQHQLAGLTNPEESTAKIHIAFITQAFVDAFKQPLGNGIGRGTLANQKVGDFANAESDLPNVFAGMGLPAGFAYAALIMLTLFTAFRVQMLQGEWRHLAWLGILVSDLNQWWSGNLYAVSTILWLVMGGVSNQWAMRYRVQRKRGGAVTAIDEETLTTLVDPVVRPRPGRRRPAAVDAGGAPSRSHGPRSGRSAGAPSRTLARLPDAGHAGNGDGNGRSHTNGNGGGHRSRSSTAASRSPR